MEKFKDVIAGDTLVLVDFYATWCQPCRAMHPVLQDVKQALGDKVRILKIDIDQYQALATEYRIRAGTHADDFQKRRAALATKRNDEQARLARYTRSFHLGHVSNADDSL